MSISENVLNLKPTRRLNVISATNVHLFIVHPFVAAQRLANLRPPPDRGSDSSLFPFILILLPVA
jgi:hypothetical protein